MRPSETLAKWRSHAATGVLNTPLLTIPGTPIRLVANLARDWPPRLSLLHSLTPGFAQSDVSGLRIDATRLQQSLERRSVYGTPGAPSPTASAAWPIRTRISRMPGCDAMFPQGAHGFDGGHGTQVAVELSPLGTEIDMRAEENRLERAVAALAPSQDVSGRHQFAARRPPLASTPWRTFGPRYPRPNRPRAADAVGEGAASRASVTLSPSRLCWIRVASMRNPETSL